MVPLYDNSFEIGQLGETSLYLKALPNNKYIQ